MSSGDQKKVSTHDVDVDIERQVFSAARLLEGSTREAYLSQVCADNRELHQRIVNLLEASDTDTGLLDRNFKSVYFELSGSSETKNGGKISSVEEVLALLEPCDSDTTFGRVAHYCVNALIGRGAFGVVFKAFDEKLERDVAIKVLNPSLSTIPVYRERFLKEARAAASIQHPNVVKIHSVEESPFPYIVMELVNGETLQERIRRQGPMPNREILELSIQVAHGLAAAHKQGLVHLDVKPSNILLDHDSDGKPRAKLTDFGLALVIDAYGQVIPESVLGTPAYMSPEQANGGKIDQRADLFSLGSVIFAMCSGQAAFAGGETASVLRGVAHTERAELPDGVRVSRGLYGIINRLHSILPRDRYRSADEVLRDLSRLSRSRVSRLISSPLTWAMLSVAATVIVAVLVFLPSFASKASWSEARQQLLDVTTEIGKADRQFNAAGCVYEIMDGKLTYVRMPFAKDLSALSNLADVEHLFLEPPGTEREVPVDISFVDGMKSLRNLEIQSFPAKSLEPLRGLPLEKLHLWYCRLNAQPYPSAIDLEPLRGMPLSWLNCGGCGVNSLEPLAGMKLEFLCMNHCIPVADLAPLSGMPLHTLMLDYTDVSDLTPLIGTPIKILSISGTKVRDLSPLIHLELEEIHMMKIQVDDLSILKKCNIRALRMDYDPSQRDLVKSIPGLERLNGLPLEEFLASQEVASNP